MKEIPLTQNKVAVIDDDNYEQISQFKWRAYGHFKQGLTCYAARFGDSTEDGRRTIVLMHRAIISAPVGLFVDHINGDGLDNRKSNLRLATRSQNGINKGKSYNNTSGYKGVGRYRDGVRWYAQITHHSVHFHLGLFATPELAAQAYDAKAAELFGEYARLNFSIRDDEPLLVDVSGYDKVERVGPIAI